MKGTKSHHIKRYQEAHLDVCVFESGDRDKADPKLGRRRKPCETETTWKVG